MKAALEGSTSITALKRGSIPVQHRFKADLMEMVTVFFTGFFTSYLSFMTDPFRKDAQHGAVWILFGRKHGSGWELLSRRGCRLSVRRSHHFQVVFLLSTEEVILIKGLIKLLLNCFLQGSTGRQHPERCQSDPAGSRPCSQNLWQQHLVVAPFFTFKTFRFMKA